MVPVEVEAAGRVGRERPARVHGDEANARLDQLAADQITRAAMPAAILLAYPVRLAAVVERLRHARTHQGVERLLVEAVHAADAQTIALRTEEPAIDRLQQPTPVGES